MKNIRLYQVSASFKGASVAAIIFIIWVVAIFVVWAPLYFYMGKIVEEMKQESAEILKFYANIHSKVASEDIDRESNISLKFFFDEIISKTDIPLIYTDSNKKSIYWEGIEVDPDDQSPEAYTRVQQIVQELEGEIDPIPIKHEKTAIGYLYYGDSDLIQRLRYLPYIEIGVVGIFILLGMIAGFLLFKNIKKAEQRHIWVGMAKETAHQLGTPLSSLMGWLELIKSNEMECDLTRKTVNEMSKDVNRLYKIAARFSQIGSKADLTCQDIIPYLRDVVAYIRRRLPHLKKEVRIIENYEAVPQIEFNKDLFEWVVENLLKNSIDAIKSDKGKIVIHVGELQNKKGKIFIDISDNGVGILPIYKSVIFKPGYSTKKRGWGLGLNLAKRIVEEYHGGKLFIKDTKVGSGTTMRIIL
ncbi:HAMP domain-containing histidine kinase [candidate division KSB1 bacterium]|nr:HAMP domain-containing histidine kinase [candidate division KSB1 bacterium]